MYLCHIIRVQLTTTHGGFGDGTIIMEHEN